MRRSLPSDWLNPICTISTFAKSEVVELEVLYRHEPQETREDEHHRQVVVWTGKADDCHEMVLREVARKHNPEALSVAIVGAESDRTNYIEKRAEKLLLKTFDSVIHTTHQDALILAKLVGTAIVSPGDEWQLSCSTWHDVRDIVRTNTGLRPTRYGIGRGKGESRALIAIDICLEEIARQEYGLGDAEGALLCVRSRSQDLLGREVKAITRRFRETCGATTLVEQSINYDESIDEGFLEVFVFAFGGPSLPQAQPR